MNVAGRRIDTDPIHLFGPERADRRTLCGARIGGDWVSGSYLTADDVATAREGGEEFCRRCESAAAGRGAQFGDDGEQDAADALHAIWESERKALKRSLSRAAWAAVAGREAADDAARMVAAGKLAAAVDAADAAYAALRLEMLTAVAEVAETLPALVTA